AAFKGPSRLFEPRANAVVLRCERAFISAFTRVFNALWRASLEGGRVSLCHHGAVGTVSAVHPPIKSGAGSSSLACSQVAACSRLRMTVKCLYCVVIPSDRKALLVELRSELFDALVDEVVGKLPLDRPPQDS